MGRILFTAFFGGIAGLAAWLLMEPSAPVEFFDPRWQGWTVQFVLLVGGCIAGTLGAVYGWHRGSTRHLLVGLAGGAAAGALLGLIGMQFGGGLAAAMFPGFDQPRSSLGVPGKVVQIGVLGALIGLAVGVPSRSLKQAVLGLIGGGIAGAVSGMLFIPLSDAMGPIIMQLKGGDEIGIVGRGVTSVVLGFAIGLFVSLAKAAAKTAWLRLELGRNEGREWVIDTHQTFIGRSEGAHVPLFGDPNIAPMHACIVRQADAFWLMDGSTNIGTRLNGQLVQSAPLFDGAQIGIGGYVLTFQMRQGSAPARAAERLRTSQPVQPVQQPAQPIPRPVSTPPTSLAGAALVALNGPLSGQRFSLGAMLDIGREATGIPLAFDAGASRRHARVEPVGNGWQVVDLGSTNGTLVNGTKVSVSVLRPGDILTIGSTQFRFDG